MRSLITLLERLPGFREVRENLTPGARRQVVGLAGSARSAFVASLFYRTRRTVLVVTARTRGAENYLDDLHVLLETPTDDLLPPVRLYPSLPTLLYDEVGLDRLRIGQRLETMEALLRGEPTVVVAPLSAVLHRTIPPSRMAGTELSLEVGASLDPADLLGRLEQLGYERTDPVLLPGQCSQRGGIVDIYPMTSPQPVRVEFWGDAIESIRFFDVASQRSTLPQQRFTVTVSRETIHARSVDAGVLARIAGACEQQVARLEQLGRTVAAKRLRATVEADVARLAANEPFDGGDHYLPFLYDETATVVDYLPPDAVVVVDEPQEVTARAAELAQEIDEVYRRKLAAGALLALPSPLYLYHDPKAPLWRHLARIELADEATDGMVAASFETVRIPAFEGNLEAAAAAIREWRDQGLRLYATTHQVDRLLQILKARGIADAHVAEVDNIPAPGELRVVDQRLSAGFIAPAAGCGVLTDHEVFGWRQSRTRRGRGAAGRGSAALASLTELTPGETVVHVNHGIGVYVGLVTRTVGGIERDYLQIDYAGNDRLFVPVTELDRLQRYLGPEGHEPALNRLGDSAWRRSKAKARKKAELVARDLVELYARRTLEPGHGFSPDGPRQEQMEAAFLYEETPDQLRAIAEVKRDMERPEPMDRLLCGDVGFGKTEVAVRAAMKAVADGYQVVVLVPTTVLAEQHHSTFSERLSPYGVTVEVLSRFRTRREQLDVIDRLRAGQVDVVVGTHRLLSEDVRFHNLGLLVIDEEQRFGVRHKERIKELRAGVDVLTMTATPIPRSLNQALVGIRELSLLQDPPVGRRPVIVHLAERTDELLREVLGRELERDGQAYFLHNRVRTIERAARHLQRLLPQARIGVAHGQMAEDELEEVMVEVYAGRYDILVSTTIIENGLDIPNVNTILIDDCEQFGLAQLYQLIGRVGRRERQAYAYLLHRPRTTLSKEAEERVDAILELTQLGAGFEIALRDLEIRGAGNLLGTQQSGFIEEVGFELYTQMVSEALRILRGESPEEVFRVAAEVELPIRAALPAHYVPDDRQRIELYRRLANATGRAEAAAIEDELRDRFGRLPPQAENLMRLVRLRIDCDQAGVASLKLEGGTFLTATMRGSEALSPRELRVLARGLARVAQSGRLPRLNLSRDAITADLRAPREWEPLDAAEAILVALAMARRELETARAATAP